LVMSEDKDTNKEIKIDLSKEELDGLDKVRGEKSQEDFTKIALKLLINRQQHLEAKREKGSSLGLVAVLLNERRK